MKETVVKYAHIAIIKDIEAIFKKKALIIAMNAGCGRTSQYVTSVEEK